MKKLISMVLVMLMVVACFGTLSASAANTEYKIYVSDAGSDFTYDANATYTYGEFVGSTEANPSKQIFQSLNALKKAVGTTEPVDIKVILVGNTTLEKNWNVAFKSGSTLTFEGKTGNEYLILDGNNYTQFTTENNTVLRNMTVMAINADVNFGCKVGSLTMGTDDAPFDVLASGTEALGKTATGFNIFAGTGSRAGCNVVLNKGTYENVASSLGTNAAALTTGVSITVNSGATVKNLAPIGTRDLGSAYTTNVTGDIALNINGGTVNNLSLLLLDAKYAWESVAHKAVVTGKAVITITGNANVTFTSVTKDGSRVEGNYIGDPWVGPKNFSVSATEDIKSDRGVWYKGGVSIALVDYTGTKAVSAMEAELASISAVNAPVSLENHVHTVAKKDATNHTYTCTVTGCTLVADEAHTWDEGTVTKLASHTASGEKTFACTVCSETKIEEIDKTAEHSYGEWAKHDDTQHKKTCACGDVQYENHDFDEGKITTEATVDAEGVRTFTCKNCAATKTESVAKLTAPETEAETEAKTDAATTDAEKSGCGSTIGAVALVIPVVLGVALIPARKKKD